MRHWTDYLFAMRHPQLFAGWLGYRDACWEHGEAAQYFRLWAARKQAAKAARAYKEEP